MPLCTFGGSKTSNILMREAPKPLGEDMSWLSGISSQLSPLKRCENHSIRRRDKSVPAHSQDRPFNVSIPVVEPVLPCVSLKLCSLTVQSDCELLR